MTLFLTGQGATVVFERSGEPKHEEAVVRMNFAGASQPKSVEGAGQLPGTQNYFLGADPSKWRTNIPLFEKVRYEGVYPGVDAIFYGNRQKLEWDFLVAPGSNADRIVLEFTGTKRLDVNASGDLVVHTKLGPIEIQKPVMYQERGGHRQPVEGGYRIMASNRVGFRLAKYNTNLPLVIDPALAYSTLLGGGSCCSDGTDIVVNSAGNAFISGNTFARDFPISSNLQGNAAGNADVFVAKLNPAGTALIYSAYLGGGKADYAWGIDVDSAGNAYVAGDTDSLDFPVKSAAQITMAGTRDVFLTKLNSAGNALVYSTYLGGSSFEYANMLPLAVKKATGDVYIAGSTGSLDFPTLSPYQVSYGGCVDTFLAKYTSAGVKQFATYLGGPGCDSGRAIAVDAASNIYVMGETNGGFPVTAGAVQPQYHGGDVPAHITKPLAASPLGYNGGGDLFIAKLTAGGSKLVYSTYLGGSGWDAGTGIDIHSSGSIYVTGYTNSKDFPVTPGVIQPKPPDGVNGFVARLNSLGTALQFSTFVGGSKDDYARGIAVEEPSGNAAVVGYTYSADFPSINAIQPLKGGSKAAIYRIANGGAQWIPADSGISDMYGNVVAVSPTDPASAVASADRTYWTTDGASSWRVANGLGSAQAFAYATASTVYAASDQYLFKSLDAGRNWVFVGSIPDRVWALAVHPTNHEGLYAATEANGIFYSSDGGANWASRSQCLWDLHVRALVISPSNPNILYSATLSAVFKTTDGGNTWSSVGAATNSLAIHPSDPNTLYTPSLKSVDGGAHWNYLGVSGWKVALAQSNPSIVYVIGDGVFRSTDAGATWTRIGKGLGRAFTIALAVAPSDSSIVYLGANVPSNAFVTRLNATGKSYLSSTYLGGADGSHDNASSVALNGSDAYVVGYAGSSDFPTTTGAFLRDSKVTQAFVAKITAGNPACSYQPYPASKFFYPWGGTQMFSVVVPSNCSWSASSDAAWIRVTDGASGKGTRSVMVDVAANGGPARTGNLIIGSQSVPIRQAAGTCSYNLDKLNLSVPSGGGATGLWVTAPEGCEWVAEKEFYNCISLTPTGWTSGTGVNVNVEPNAGPTPRQATFTVAGWNVTLDQPGTACPLPDAPITTFPVQNATGITLTPTLKWNAVSKAISYDVYFGPKNMYPPLAGNTAGTTYSPGALATGTVYFWRVGAKTACGSATNSLVRKFTTAPNPLPATSPSPANGAAAVSRTVTLQWQAGAGATSYDVYFGVAPNPPKLRNVTSTQYSPGTLLARKKYYWKVVSKSATGSKASPIWSFTTQ